MRSPREEITILELEEQSSLRRRTSLSVRVAFADHSTVSFELRARGVCVGYLVLQPDEFEAFVRQLSRPERETGILFSLRLERVRSGGRPRKDEVYASVLAASESRPFRSVGLIAMEGPDFEHFRAELHADGKLDSGEEGAA